VKQKWDRSGLDITHLLTHAAREPELTLVFNWAAQLLNNSYFMETMVSWALWRKAMAHIE
jgi:Fe-Mn family superoxide dismutase